MKPLYISRRTVLQTLAALGGTALLGNVSAQSAWPTKPVKLVVPFNPGGATDLIARTLAEALSKRIGQPVIVENKGGAAGVLGTSAVTNAQADGYTFLLSLSTSMLINQFLYTKLPYSPQKDLLMLSQIAGAPVTLVVHPSIPANTMPELLAYAKANKGKLSYGSWGVGSYAHLAGAYMSKTTESDMVHVAYKGESPMIQDLIGGNIQVCFSSAINTRPFIESGRVKVIGVTGTTRMEILPQVPTLHEQGVTDDAYSIFGWVALGAPAGLPQNIVDTLYGHLKEIIKEPQMLERIKGAGFIPMMNSPQDFQRNYQRDMTIWKALVETADAKLD
ncbi:MAG: tripartite tricarboxylate transporter substrate binding protein [Alcaligenaceae bacterium]|nr:tripartite tricarboxylate transporter substrate binding protein [Alcaligenaceae bacterium]